MAPNGKMILFFIRYLHTKNETNQFSRQPAHFKCLKTYNPPSIVFHKTKAAIPRIYKLILKKLLPGIAVISIPEFLVCGL